MLNMCLISIITVLSVLGIYFLVKEITSFFLKNDVHSTITLEIYKENEELEHTIRSVLSANPKSDIFVIDKSKNNEIEKILQSFSDDNSRIHIKAAPEK